MSDIRYAFHEAGHTLVMRALGRPIELVAISPDGGITRATEPLAGDRSPEALERSLVCILAGEIAEGYAPAAPISIPAAEHASTNGGPDPYALVTGLVETAGTEDGPSDAEVVERYHADLGDERFERCRSLAVELVERKAAVGHLGLIADRLYLAGVLTGEDVERLLGAPA